jgi:hypothetical protein
MTTEPRRKKRPHEPQLFARCEKVPGNREDDERVEFAIYLSIHKEGEFRRIALEPSEAVRWFGECLADLKEHGVE